MQLSNESHGDETYQDATMYNGEKVHFQGMTAAAVDYAENTIYAASCDHNSNGAGMIMDALGDSADLQKKLFNLLITGNFPAHHHSLLVAALEADLAKGFDS